MFRRLSILNAFFVRLTAVAAALLIFTLAMAAHSVELHNFLHGHPPDHHCEDPLCVVNGFASGKALTAFAGEITAPCPKETEDTGLDALASLVSAPRFLKKPGRDPPAAVSC